MLDNEYFVVPATNGCHRAEDDPRQRAPGGKAFPHNLVVLELVANVVVRCPGTEEVPHVHSSCEKHTSSAPPVKPIETFIADTTKTPYYIILAR